MKTNGDATLVAQDRSKSTTKVVSPRSINIIDDYQSYVKNKLIHTFDRNKAVSRNTKILFHMIVS